MRIGYRDLTTRLKLQRKFVYSKLNFTMARLAQRYNFADNKVLFQLNLPQSTLQVPFDQSKTLEELGEIIKVKTGCQSYQFISPDHIKLNNATTLSQLYDTDFFLLIDESTLVRFENQNYSKPVQMHQDLDEYINKMCHPPYYYASVVKNYIQRVDVLFEEKKGFPIFDSSTNERQRVKIDDVLRVFVEALPDPSANQGVNAEQILSEIGVTRSKLDVMEEKKEELMDKAKFRAKLSMSGGLVALIGYFNFVFFGTYYIWSWDVVEPLAYFMALGGTIFAASRYFKLKDDYQMNTYYEYLTQKHFKRLAIKNKFDLEEYEKTKQHFETLKDKLKLSMLVDL